MPDEKRNRGLLEAIGLIRPTKQEKTVFFPVIKNRGTVRGSWFDSPRKTGEDNSFVRWKKNQGTVRGSWFDSHRKTGEDSSLSGKKRTRGLLETAGLIRPATKKKQFFSHKKIFKKPKNWKKEETVNARIIQGK